MFWVAAGKNVCNELFLDTQKLHSPSTWKTNIHLNLRSKSFVPEIYEASNWCLEEGWGWG